MFWGFAFIGFVSAGEPDEVKQEKAVESIVGTYHYVPGTNDPKMIKDQVEQSISEMNPAFRYIARPKLNRGSAIDSMIELKYVEGQMTIIHQNKIEKAQITVPIGKPVKSQKDRSVVHTLKWRSPKSQLERIDQTRNGGRSIIYDIKDGGNTLEIKVKMFSNLIPKPIKYTLKYVKKLVK